LLAGELAADVESHAHRQLGVAAFPGRSAFRIHAPRGANREDVSFMAFMPALSKFLDFQDAKECARVRAIKRKDICKHPNKDFKIRILDNTEQFYAAFALDIVNQIVRARDESRKCVLILPVGPVPQYEIAANMINTLKIDCSHLVTYNMDEYADENGQTAPADWAGSFATSMWAGFFGKLDKKLRPKEENIHFPNTANIGDYSNMIADEGGADCCYGGIGWCGHIAFWEASLGHEFKTLKEYKAAGARIVELTPLTIVQNCLHSFGGDWSWVPPKAASIGPRDILGAKMRSFWLDGMCGPFTGMSWQRFIARLAAHCYVNKFVPGTLLQEVRTDYSILSGVADDVAIDMS
jgi:glucosamine-6-phosphate deaminase